MPDPEQIVDEEPQKLTSDESTIFGVSIRGLLTIILVLCVCVMSMMDKQVSDPLYGMSMLAIGFYYGQSKKR